MSNYINDRVFGSDLAFPIRKTLERRQKQNMNPDFGQSVSDNERDVDYNKNINFSKPGDNLDLSSRKPWARMWTVIRGYMLDQDGKRVEDTSGNVRIYEVGNNSYDDYNFNKKSSNSVNKSLPDSFLTSNKFLKPAAGITHIQSTSQGPLGIYNETIINFKVFNFFDYSNIFAKYFLYPGAKIFLDFGWDTSDIYAQKKYFSIDGSDGDADKNYGKFTQDIFTFADYSGGVADGLIAKSGGSLSVIEGYVTDWTSKTDLDGSFDCSITVTSGNKALLSTEKKGYLNLGGIFRKDIRRVIIEKFFRIFKLKDGEFFNLDFMFRNPGSEETSQFYQIILNKLQSNENLDLGDFYDRENRDNDFGNIKIWNDDRTLYKDMESDEEWKTWDENQYAYTPAYSTIPEIAQDIGVFYQYLEDPSSDSQITGGASNTYITIKFLEEELLNKNLGIEFTEDLNKKIAFDSSDQISRFSEELYNVQIWTKNYVNLKFLYPTRDFNEFKKSGKIPISDLFVDLNLVLDSIDSEEDITSAIKRILDTISRASYGIMKLVLKDRGDNKLTIVDLNNPLINSPESFMDAQSSGPNGEDITSDEDGKCYYLDSNTNEKKITVCPHVKQASDNYYNFDELFVFDPYSNNSVVSSMDLKLEMPSNTMASIIAINATSMEKEIYPGTPGTRLGLGLKDLYVPESNNSSGSAGKAFFEWLPAPNNKSDSVNDNQFEHSLTQEEIQNMQDTTKADPNFKEMLNKYTQYFGKYDKNDSMDAMIKELKKEYDGAIKYFVDKATTVDLKKKKPAKDKNKKDVKLISCSGIPEFYIQKLTQKLIGRKNTNPAPFILPYSLNLSLYGISGLVPGNVFRVNYLPEVYADKIVFIAETVSHTITAGSWITSIGAYSMYRTDKAFKNVNLLEPTITWEPSFIRSMGYSDDQIRKIIDDPDYEFWKYVPNALRDLEQASDLYSVGPDGNVATMQSEDNTLVYAASPDLIFDYEDPLDDDPGDSDTGEGPPPGCGGYQDDESGQWINNQCGCMDESSLTYDGQNMIKDCSGNPVEELITFENVCEGECFDFTCCTYSACGDWLAGNWNACLGYGSTYCDHYIYTTYAKNSILGVNCFMDAVNFDPSAGNSPCIYPDYDNEYYSLRFCQNICNLCGTSSGGWLNDLFNICDEQECTGITDPNFTDFNPVYPESLYGIYGLGGTQGICQWNNGSCVPNLDICRPDFGDAPWDSFYPWAESFGNTWPNPYDENKKYWYMWHHYQGVSDQEYDWTGEVDGQGFPEAPSLPPYDQPTEPACADFADDYQSFLDDPGF